VANLLVVPEDMEEDLAYQILTTLFDNKTELVTVHVERLPLSALRVRRARGRAL
jgi:TRAP-type uncharacterized transport system substrate-binding protein